MQRDRPDEMDKQWIDQHVEAYVDGELSRRDRRVVERAVATDPEVRDWVMTAQRVKRELREIPTAECPPDVTDAVIRRIEAMEPARPRWSAVPTMMWRPALVLAACVLLLFTVLQRPDEQAPPIADADVAEALLEVKWTLAYLNDLGSQTGRTIRDDVLQEGVVRPIERGLGLHTPASAQ